MNNILQWLQIKQQHGASLVFTDESVELSVRSNPVAKYGFSIYTYNREQNIVDNIKLEQPEGDLGSGSYCYHIFYHPYYSRFWVFAMIASVISIVIFMAKRAFSIGLIIVLAVIVLFLVDFLTLCYYLSIRCMKCRNDSKIGKRYFDKMIHVKELPGFQNKYYSVSLQIWQKLQAGAINLSQATDENLQNTVNIDVGEVNVSSEVNVKHKFMVYTDSFTNDNCKAFENEPKLCCCCSPNVCRFITSLIVMSFVLFIYSVFL